MMLAPAIAPSPSLAPAPAPAPMRRIVSAPAALHDLVADIAHEFQVDAIMRTPAVFGGTCSCIGRDGTVKFPVDLLSWSPDDDTTRDDTTRDDTTRDDTTPEKAGTQEEEPAAVIAYIGGCMEAQPDGVGGFGDKGDRGMPTAPTAPSASSFNRGDSFDKWVRVERRKRKKKAAVVATSY